MNKDKDDLLIVRKTDFEKLLGSVDLLAHRFTALLTELKQTQRERTLSRARSPAPDIRAAARSSSTGRTVCRQCGRDLDPSSKFCDLCGTRLRSA